MGTSATFAASSMRMASRRARRDDSTATPPAITVPNEAIRPMGSRSSNIDVHDLLHPHDAHGLETRGGGHHDLSDPRAEEQVQVIGIHLRHVQRHEEWET